MKNRDGNIYYEPADLDTVKELYPIGCHINDNYHNHSARVVGYCLTWAFDPVHNSDLPDKWYVLVIEYTNTDLLPTTVWTGYCEVYEPLKMDANLDLDLESDICA